MEASEARRSHTKAAVAVLALQVLVLVVAVPLAYRAAGPAPLPRIRVAWVEEISPSERARLAAELGLVGEQTQEGESSSYGVPNATPERIRAIVEHPAVTDTHGVDRQAMTLSEPFSGRPYRLRLLGRWLLLVAYGSLFLLPAWVVVSARSGGAVTGVSDPGTGARVTGLGRVPAGAIAALGLIVSVWIAMRMPLAITDNFAILVRVQQHSWWQLFVEVFTDSVEWRPMLYLAPKAVAGLMGSISPLGYRIAQVALIVAWVVALQAVARPRPGSRTAGFAVTLLCALALPSSRILFSGPPLNTILLLVVIVLGALAVIERGGPRLVTAAAPILSFIALLHYELGLVVAAVFVLGWWLGFESVPRVAVVGAVVAVLAWAALRWGLAEAAGPPAFFRETGFGFTSIEIAEQERRFGSQPLLLYVYNVLATVSSVLFGEPRAGRFDLLAGVVQGETTPHRWIGAVTTSLSSGVIFAWLVVLPKTPALRRRALLYGLLGLASCAFGFLYTRDRIGVLAGLFFALLLGEAAAAWLRLVRAQSSRRVQAVVLGCLVLIGVGWGSRVVGNVLFLDRLGQRHAQEWRAQPRPRAEVLGRFFEETLDDPDAFATSPLAVGVWETLREDALRLRPREPGRPPADFARWFEIE